MFQYPPEGAGGCGHICPLIGQKHLSRAPQGGTILKSKGAVARDKRRGGGRGVANKRYRKLLQARVGAASMEVPSDFAIRVRKCVSTASRKRSWMW